MKESISFSNIGYVITTHCAQLHYVTVHGYDGITFLSTSPPDCLYCNINTIESVRRPAINPNFMHKHKSCKILPTCLLLKYPRFTGTERYRRVTHICSMEASFQAFEDASEIIEMCFSIAQSAPEMDFVFFFFTNMFGILSSHRRHAGTNNRNEITRPDSHKQTTVSRGSNRNPNTPLPLLGEGAVVHGATMAIIIKYELILFMNYPHLGIKG